MAARTATLPPKILSIVKGVLGDPTTPVPLHAPLFVGREWDYVKDCLDSTWVSSVGRYVERFETMLEQQCGVARAIAVVNGTCALHMALLLAGVEPGEEVLVPALTFVATANAVHHAGATPHFVDCEARSLGLDADKLEAHLAATVVRTERGCCNKVTGRRIRVVVPMHVFGHPADLDALSAVCLRWGLTLVEDAAEALGSRYKDRPVGGHGRLAILSFNGNKIVTCGGGGAILTNDQALADKAKHLTTTAKVPHPWRFEHDAPGFNYRLPNLNAALGCAQMECLSGFVDSKRALARRYQDAFDGLDGLTVLREPAYGQSNYWLNALLLDRPDPVLRDTILEQANAAGFGFRPAWTLLHRLPMYAACPRGDLSTADALEGRIINLPSGAAL